MSAAHAFLGSSYISLEDKALANAANVVRSLLKAVAGFNPTLAE